jgi:hypothetical protein
MTELTGIIDKYGVYIYKNPLIYFNIETFSNWRHREATVQKDPMANAYIQRLDEEIMSEYPTFTPDILGSKKPEKKTNPLTGEETEEESGEEDKELKREWIEEGFTDLIITMMNAARTHKWCIVKLYDRAPFWRVFTYREITKILYDKYDNPVSARAEWEPTLPLHQEGPREHKETIVFNRDDNTMEESGLFVTFGNPVGKHMGMSDLEPIWDLLVYIRYQMLDIVNNSAKTSGFYHIIYGDAIKPAQKTALKNAFDYTGAGQAIGAKERILKDIKFHTPDHPEFTVEAMNESLKLLAGATRLPFSFYMGEKEGGGVFQEGFSDESKINKKKLYVFGQFKKYIIQLVRMRWGKEVEEVIPFIKEEIEQDQQFEQDASNQFKNDHFDNKKNKQVTNKIA